jgi:tetratricopeptide (TPR) repeat protein
MRARAKALRGWAYVEASQGGDAAQRARWEECLALSRELDFRGGIAWALQALGHMAHSGSEDGADPGAAQAFYGESLTIFREIGHKAGTAELIGNLASLSLSQGDYSAARLLYEESLALSREAKRSDRIAVALHGLARVAQAQGDRPTARSLLGGLEALGRKPGRDFVVWTVRGLQGDLLLEMGDTAAARSFSEESLALRRAAEDPEVVAWALLEGV